MKFKIDGGVADVNVFKYKLNWDKIEGSGPEKKVLNFLKKYWKNDFCLVQFRIPRTLMRCDFINITKKIAIETSPGATHDFSPFFHKSKVVFGQRLKKELEKEQFLLNNSFKYIELGDEELANLSAKMFKEKFDIDLIPVK